MKTISRGKIGFVIVIVASMIFATGLDRTRDGSAHAGGTEIKKVAFDPKKTCELLQIDEVEAQMQSKVESPEPQDGFCMFSIAEPPPNMSFAIMVSPFDTSGGSMKDFMLMLQKETKAMGHVVKPIEELPYDAFFQIISSEWIKYIHLLKGNNYFVFQSQGSEGKELSEEQVKILVKKALDRL